MKEIRGKTIEEWRRNAEWNYANTPISVLKYITILEEQLPEHQQPCKYIKPIPITHREPFVLNGDMANEFNDSFDDEENDNEW